MNGLQKILGRPNRILVFPFDLMAHYLRCLKLVTELDVSEICFESSLSYNHMIKGEGFNTFDCESFNPEYVLKCAQKFDFKWLNQADLERILDSQVAAIKKHEPDLVIGDTSPTLKMAAEICNVKYVSLMNGYMSKHYGRVRGVSRNHPAYNHIAKLPPTVVDVITSTAEKIAFKIVHKPFKNIRKNKKLTKLNSYIEEMEGDVNLLCDDLKLFPQKSLPSNYFEIGPLFWGGGKNIKQENVKINGEKKTVLVCMGSSGEWSKLSMLGKESFSKYNVITAGDKGNVVKGGHITSYDFVNLESVLKDCDLFVCHGGSGVSSIGVKSKVPMLFLTSHFEQEWNVAGLIESGLGEDLSGFSESEIEKSIHQKLNDKNVSIP